MDKLGLDIDDGTVSTTEKQANPQEARELSIQRCIQTLVHACQCRDANCRLPSCQRMKRVVQHTKACKMKVNGNCPICKQLISLCFYHAKYCQDTQCAVPVCSSIKQKIKLQQQQQRVQQQQLLGGKPGITPPPSVLQVLKQVQEEAARQQAPHSHSGAIGYPPPQVMTQPPMQRIMAQIPGSNIGSVAHPSANIPNEQWKQSDVKEVPHTYEELNSELIQLLECPICFEYSTPPINQCLQGHIICNNCRQRVNTCPMCRTMFQESRNLIVEKVAALLSYPCKNAVTGCLETLYLLQKEQHEKSCGFRHYVCFIPMCNWGGYKPELLVHVQETHENHVIHGAIVNLMIPITGQTKRVWLMSAFNELFYVIFFATLGILKGCVRFIGDASKCDNFTYNISVTSEEEMLRNFNYTRTTHAYEETFENLDMIDSYDLFSISHAQLNLFRKGTKAPIRVTIEEAHMRQRSGLNVTASSNV